jgi:crossover junction endodeoxyribonuclease RuvC
MDRDESVSNAKDAPRSPLPTPHSSLRTPNSELQTPRRIMGLDPGLHNTGYGVIEADADGKPRLIEAGVLRIPSDGLLSARLNVLHDAVCELMDELAPSAVAVEELFSHYARPRTAVIMGHARGVLLLAAGKRGIPTASYLPTRVKRALTGHGRASKEQMQQAVQIQFDLPAPPDPPDVADALAVALCHWHHSLAMR